MLSSPLLLAASVLLPNLARAATVSKTLNIVNANLAPDGFNRRSVVINPLQQSLLTWAKPRSTTVVNGQLPGPLISGNVGDHFQVNLRAI